ncbi:hypothetical protein [uncultured Microbacterium sp.]|uniref:Uncharacterized protein n=1 Tax=uncultured Microbacterium sp. TaxID=191216 RepID=A0A1Y5NX32_9MICO|nr:hypothetical protein [uncultured Microbacterium sp.]SBS70943.1 exported hypothetical protein [uncultured Microbacterium sp.]
MSGIRWRRVAIASIVVGMFALLMTMTILQWELPVWVVPVIPGFALVAISLLARPAPPVRGSAELYAADGYSDAELGRSRPTHPFVDPEAASEIGDALPADPLRLPDSPR